MARVVKGGMIVSDAMRSGLVNSGTLNEIKRLNTEFSASLGDSASAWFKDAATTAFERFGGHKVMDRLEALTRKNEAFWDADVIRPLLSVGELQQAKRKMREYVMCHEVLSERYEDQTCHGYGGDFVHHEGHGMGNHMWRLIHDGEEYTHEGGFHGWTSWLDEPEDDEELRGFERYDCLLTHRAIDDLLMEGTENDITDPLNTGW